MSDQILRHLLHSSANNDEPHEDEHGSDGTQDLRIGALFAILFAGLIGGLPPLFFKVFRSPGAPLPRLLRALSAGIILSLACIHIIPDSIGDLGQLADLVDPPYDVGGCTVVLGIFIMVVLQSIAHSYMDSSSAANANSMGALPSPFLTAGQAKPKASAVSEAVGGQDDNSQAQTVMVVPAGAGHDAMDPHNHSCARTSHMAMQAAVISSSTLKQQAMAMMFEVGCIFHSFIIGLTLGVETEDRKAVIGLMVALCFHQWLEAIALGGFIVNAGLAAWKGLFMIVLYSLTCPVGVAVGLGIADSYDGGSVTALAVQGTFNGVSGGMLLYVALVMIIAEDFTRQDSPPSHSPSHTHTGFKGEVQEVVAAPQHTPGWLNPACHVALACGAGMMAMLAVWA
ncbi:zinc-nutrition responsive transporter [Haematococcus lacustris]